MERQRAIRKYVCSHMATGCEREKLAKKVITILGNNRRKFMAYRMIVLDLDGTLTNSKKEITKRTKEALFEAQRRGIKVVLASGRPTYGIVPLSEELELERYGSYILSFNGAQIRDEKTKEIIFRQTLPEQTIGQLIDLAEEHKVDFLTYENENIITNNSKNQYVGVEAKINQMPVVEIENMRQHITFPIPKILMVGHGEYMAMVEPKIQSVMNETLSVYRSEPFFLEVMPKGIDKAASLERLLAHTGIKREEMIACGDGFNDLSMIQFAGLGVAMKNAQEVVKQHADYITDSNDEDGVAKVVEKFLLG